jgi:hypothetical protein
MIIAIPQVFWSLKTYPTGSPEDCIKTLEQWIQARGISEQTTVSHHLAPLDQGLALFITRQ